MPDTTELMISKPIDRQKLQTAIALSKSRQLAYIAANTCELSCVCAVTDKPYVMRFKRGTNGLYQCVESIRAEYGEAGRISGKAISMREFDQDVPQDCAWCGAHAYGLCKCKSLVCTGRTKGTSFRCRDSCGATWEGSPLKKVKASNAAKQKPAYSGPIAFLR